MKKNLIKILAIASIALAAGACKGKTKKSEAPVVTIQELLELNNEGKWALEGQTVKIENLSLQGKYGNTLIGGTSVGETVVDLRGVEIRCKELPALERSGYGADISAEGRVVDVNGRLTLQDAVVTVNSERGEDGKASEGHGLPISYCPPNATSRSLFDGYFSRIFSGALIEGIYQLASVPGQMSATSEAASFSVVFPGEDTDAADTANESIITVNYAAGSEVSDKAVEGFNKYFEGKKVGDFVEICANLQWDNQANAGGMGLILENYWLQLGLEEVKEADKPVIYASWAEMAEANNSIFDGGLIDLGPEMYDDDSNPDTPDVQKDPNDKLALPFSYLVDDSYLADPKAPWKDEYKDQLVLVSDVKACADLVVTANFKPAGIEDYFDAIEARLTGLAQPFVLNESFAESGIYIFTQTIDAKVVKEVLIQVNNSSSFDIHLIAPKASLSFATFAEFKARLELTASNKLSKLAGSAKTHTSSLVDFPEGKRPNEYVFTWMYENMADAYYTTDGAFIRYDVEFKFASAEAAAAALTAYQAALNTAGYVEGKDTNWQLTGLFNSTSRELVALEQGWDSTAKAYTSSIEGYVIVVDETYVSNGYIGPLPASDAALATAVGAKWDEIHGQVASYLGGTGLPTDMTAGTNATTKRDYNFDFSTYGSNGILVCTVELTYAENLTTDQLNTILGKFSSMAQAQLVCFDPAPTGFWNSATNEFFRFSYNENILTIRIYKIHSGAVSSYVQTA